MATVCAVDTNCIIAAVCAWHEQHRVAAAEVERRLANQISDAERAKGAACVIRNDGTLDELRRSLEQCWHERIAARSGALET